MSSFFYNCTLKNLERYLVNGPVFTTVAILKLLKDIFASSDALQLFCSKFPLKMHVNIIVYNNCELECELFMQI